MKEHIEETEVDVVRDMPAVLQRSSVLLMPVMDKNTALKRLQEFQEFVGSYLTESQDGGNDGGDYGVIPGTKKKTLLKSGADKLCELYGLADEYDIKGTVDWEAGLFDYEIKCILKSRRDDSIVGTGVGSCSSFESKYRWRDQKRKCPSCGLEIIIKGKDQYGGGWLCWKKQGGCGATFKDGDKAIEAQVIGRVENADIVDIKNTVLKMAKKRAKIDAIIGATRSSGIFSQDLDELGQPTTTTIQPETTTEAKTYSRKQEDIAGPGSTSAEPIRKGTAKPRDTNGGQSERVIAKDAAPIEAENEPFSAPAHEAFATKEMQDWLRMEFKSLLPVKYHPHADQFRRDFLKSKGYVNDDGVGTSKKIPLLLFKAVAKECLNHAKTLEAL